jgi:putative transposase
VGKQRKLRKLADATAKLWKETNYERQQFFQQKNVNFKETWRKYYEKYKTLLENQRSSCFQKNNLVVLLLVIKTKTVIRESLLTTKLLEGGKRKLILVVRQDRYEVDEERHVISLKDWEMKMPFEG